jgi:hypothetical protein
MAKSYKNRRIRKIKTNKRKTTKRKTTKRKTTKRKTTKRKTTKCKTKRKMQHRRYKGGATTIDYKKILDYSLTPLDEASMGLTLSELNNSSRNVKRIIKDIKTLLDTDTTTEELKKKLIVVVVQILNYAYTKINEGIAYKQNSLVAATKIQKDAQLSSSETPPIESLPTTLPTIESQPSTNTIPA